MFDIDNYETYEIVNIIALIIGLLFGAIAQKNQFCFSGSIKDYILTKSKRRISSVIMAMIVAIVATYTVSIYYEIDLLQTIYYKKNINYFSIILGSILFGIGMTIADGCSSRHLVKLAQGDTKSMITIPFIAIFAYASTKGILYHTLLKFTSNEYLINISANIQNIQLNIYMVIVVLSLLLLISVKKLKRIWYLKDGMFIGLLIAFSWCITGVIGEQSIQRDVILSSITFVYPTAQSLELFTYYNTSNLSFGVSVVLGVVIGAFIMSKFNKKYSFGCTSSFTDKHKVKNNMIGGAMMGIGGVMAIGCTVGQGLTGFSTLAFASMLSIVTILSAGYLTALYLNKKNELPMCFIFEWQDEINKKG